MRKGRKEICHCKGGDSYQKCVCVCVCGGGGGGGAACTVVSLFSRGQTHTEGRVWSSCNDTLVLCNKHVEVVQVPVNCHRFCNARVVQGENSLA